MISGLLNIPRTNNEWQWFSWQHRLSHDRIRQAIQKTYGVNLTDYQIDPIEPNDVKQFLQDNSSLHSDMNGVLKLPTVNLLDINLENPNELGAWIYYHFQEHFDAEAKLGVGS